MGAHRLKSNHAIICAMIAALMALATGCKAVPTPDGHMAMVGSTRIYSFATPLRKHAADLPLKWYSLAQPGQVLIADVISYSGTKVGIEMPDGWSLIRDDLNLPVRQTLYWRRVEPGGPEAQTWTFSEPVETQGAVLILDSAAARNPIDASSGNSGNGWQITSKSVGSSDAGDLLLEFYATGYGGVGLSPKLPAGMTRLVDRSNVEKSYWVDAAFRGAAGVTGDATCAAVQLAPWVAVQVAIRWVPGAAVSDCGGRITSPVRALIGKNRTLL